MNVPFVRLVVFWSAMFASTIRVQAAPQAIRVEVSRDVWISAYSKEREGNNGGSPKLKLKGIQEFFLIDFDPVPFKGKHVVRSQLHLHPEGPETLGRITVSSITDEWFEGGGTSYAKTPGASCFNWKRTGEEHWSGDGPDITGVTLGNGGSIWGFGDATSKDANGWQVIPIEPAVVQARIDGMSHGFFVMDDVGSEYSREGNTINYRQFPNRYVASSEGPKKTAPYFTLWLDDARIVNGNATPRAKVSVKGALKPAPLPVLPKGEATSTRSAVPCRDTFGGRLDSLQFRAARGEAIGFIVEAMPSAVQVRQAGSLEIDLFAMPEVGGQMDPLIPAGFNVGSGIPTNAASTYVEIHVPKLVRPGLHSASLAVAGKELPFSVAVWNFSLPDRLSFIPQMNCYSLPGHEIDYYRLAHQNRTTLNQLRYGWTGKVDQDAVPVKRADGSWDWAAWDAKFGPMLDGSAFKGLWRDGVPIEAIYLPLNENWPMNHEQHFHGGYWIESAYDEAYWKEFRDITAEFARHLKERGWTEPMFEFYLNNKVYFKRDRGNRWDACSAPWIFDEPVNTQDFWALRRFGTEFWSGVAKHPGARFTFRADISRPEWQRDLLDGVTSVEVVSGVLRTYRERVVERAQRLGNLVYMYGSANVIGTPDSMPAAWCVETWALGADGVVPWQTIGRQSSWEKPDQLSLFYPTSNGPVPSLRLKSFMAGQQLAEYLTIYAILSGQGRESVGAAVLALPGLSATLNKKSEDDAGTSQYGAAMAKTLAELRLRLGAWIDVKSPAERKRWHDPRPKVRDANSVSARAVVQAK